MAEALTSVQIEQRRQELKEIDLDREHYLSEHIRIAQDLTAELTEKGKILDNEGFAKVCTKGHTISAVFKGKMVVPTIIDSFRPVAYRKPSI